MPAGAWIMLVFGALILWGGLAVCLVIAHRSGKAGRGERPAADPD